MTSPTDRILELVCGLANPHRDRKPLLMLQAYVDESKEDGDQILVFAGYVAPATKWLPFSDEWAECLFAPPGTDYLKNARGHGPARWFSHKKGLDR